MGVMSEYMNKVEAGKRAWFEAIGEFVNAFEHLIGQLRFVVFQDCGTNTNESQTKIISFLASQSAKELVETIERLLPSHWAICKR